VAPVSVKPAFKLLATASVSERCELRIRPRPRSTRHRRASFLHDLHIDGCRGVAPLTTHVRQHVCDLIVGEGLSERRHQTSRSLFAVHQNANGNGWRSRCERRPDERWRNHLLAASILLMTRLADALVDRLSRGKALLRL